MIVVAAHHSRRISSHPSDHFTRIWSVVEEIAKAPQLIELAFRKHLEGSKVRLGFGSDHNFHKAPSRAAWSYIGPLQID